ncbi:uncharacterized protein LOC142179843 [Nicotiana tabacum]|uniref:Uncharacterized protein LOC142179843 n=2 Tax=Nicotiana TaxID=4085 RepID=A0AC58UBG5_TOBAC
MPPYDKFLKEILSNKRKVEKTSVVKFTEHCSTILQNKLPKKCGDPGNFTIPCSIYRKLEGEIGEIRLILVPLQLADQTTIIPEGIMEDVLVRVDKFVFPVDFIVVNREENKEVPWILGRPFLATGGVILYIQARQLMLRVGEEMVVFKMEGSMGPLKKLAGESKNDKCGVYPKKIEMKLSSWMCALGQACKGDPDFDSDPD